jgi:NADH-quinone oxidoreductase subunit K
MLNLSTIIKKINVEQVFFQNEITNLTTITQFLFAFLIFFIGILGVVFNFQNFLVTMMSVELIYLGIILLFILVSIHTYDPKGQIYALIFLIIAASESAIGLGLLIVLYRFGKTINFEDFQSLRG